MEPLVRLGTPALIIILRTLIVYVVVLLGLRLTGKREIGQFAPFDLVLVLLIANAVQNAMVGPDNSLLGGLVAAVTLLAVNYVVGRISRRKGFAQRWLLGQPAMLIHEGHVVEANMMREQVTEAELLAAIREHGFDRIEDVRVAVLEVDGTISVVAMNAKVFHSRRHVRQIKHA